MKNTFYLLLIVVIVYSCKTIPNGFHLIDGTIPIGSNDKRCDKVFNDVKKKWAANDSLPKCYFYNKKLLAEIEENKQCFIGKDTVKIINLFGEHTNRYYYNESWLQYSLSEVCKDTIEDLYFPPYTLYFYYSKKGKVVKIEIEKIVKIE